MGGGAKGKTEERATVLTQGTKRNYSSLNCFHYTKYSNIFLKRGAEIILKKVNATAPSNTSWGLFSHLLARRVPHTLRMHLTSLLKIPFPPLTGRHPTFRIHKPWPCFVIVRGTHDSVIQLFCKPIQFAVVPFCFCISCKAFHFLLKKLKVKRTLQTIPLSIGFLLQLYMSYFLEHNTCFFINLKKLYKI